MVALEKIKLLIKQIIDPALLGVGNLGANSISAIFWFYLATIINAKDYGQINYALAVASVSSTATLLGSNTAVTTYFAKGNEAILKQIHFLAFLASSIAAAAVAGLTQNVTTGILLLGISSFSMAVAEELGKKRYKYFTLLMITNRISQVVLSLALYYVIGVEGIILGYAISTMAFGYRMFNLKNMSFSFSEIRPKFGFMVDAYSFNLSESIVVYADKLVISAFFSLSILGLYQLGFQFLMFLSVIPVSLYQYLLPSDASGVERKVVRKMGLILAILLAILFYLLSPYLINGLFPKYSSAIPAAQIMAFGVIPLSISSILNSKILGRAKNTRPVLLGAGAYVVSLFLSMYFLGKIFGLEGLAVGVVLSISLQSLTLWICNIIQNKSLSINQ